MNILVIGEQKNFDECQAKFGKDHVYTWLGEHRDFEGFVDQKDLVIDFTISEDPYSIEGYAKKTVDILCNTCTVTLAELASLANNSLKCTLFGFNGMPTLLNRPVLEVSLLNKADEPSLKTLCNNLHTDYLVVDDTVGLVTPRVICMIINEAFYTVQEGTASRQDIDKAMKLGTNYPYGPFEWSSRIGIRYVYEVLEAMYEETKDERYKICQMLKKEYLRS